MNQSYREAYPLNFELFNKDQEPVLYIARNNQQLTLEVVNQGQKAMQFLPVKQAPNSKSFHFALTFRPDTLNDQCLKKGVIKPSTETAETWNMSNPMLASNGEVTLYFTRKLPPKAKSVDWKAREKIYLRLTNLAASGIQGSRGTRVQLKTDQLCFAEGNLPLQLIKQTHLNIVNHRGQKDCPLQVAIVGDPSILNDGKTANKITLRISNAHHYDAVNPGAYALRFKGNKDATNRSKIILQFPTGPIADPWALLTMDDWKKVEITEPLGWKHEDNTYFEIYPNDEVTLYEQATPLPGKSVGYAPSHVDIQLSNIITQHLAGLAHVTLHYQNIPGYWDGQRLVILEKSPVRFSRKKSSQITSITGNLNVAGKCDIEGSVQVNQEALIGGKFQAPEGLFTRNLTVKGKCHLENGLEIDGDHEYNTRLYQIPTSLFSIRGYMKLDRRGITPKIEKTRNKKFKFSLRANGNIGARQYFVISDERIKHRIQPSQTIADLNILLKIRVVDYHFKDSILHDNTPQKKVLGQQIASVFPQAVSLHTQVVPDGLHKAFASQGRISLKGHSYCCGDRLKLIFPDHSSGLFQIKDTDHEGIQLDESINSEVIIYGREVDDFHVVDYDAISMLNVSATQALHAQLTEQQQEIVTLRRELTELKAWVSEMFQSKENMP